MRERLETHVKLKPDTFDGSVPLREFIAQFDLIARANRWDVETKAVVLASCLRGKARAVLESVQNLDFVELKSKLELCFGEAQSLQNYYSQFTNRKQKFGESIASFGSDIERLSQLAYLECSDEVRDKIAYAQFVSALSDGFMRRALQLEGATSLRIAIERAKAIRLIQENNFQYKKGNNFSFENRKKQNFYKSDETEKIQNDKVKEGAFNKEKFTKFGKKILKKGTKRN
ncbi:hypothetical protein ALC57_01111 [Trachymyrmex cornetzi]|uniref:Retrotransposon gag domain-containing protein n=1 Tax=Trachymyrmex cornetzi TaxID=471704 RepID=A0A151JQC9_9HYME|nr:hypothetical protein ALC57_01111 [Trachymyrmex cornetzi]